MPIRCTISKSGVVNEYGQPLAIGTVYTPINDDYALALISQGKATDTDRVASAPGNAPYDDAVDGLVAGLSTDPSPLAATKNVSLLQAALNGGGPVSVMTPGTYFINQSLVIYSNTNLTFGKGVTLKLLAGTNRNFINTDAYANGTSTSISIAWTSGRLITVTWTGHGLARGDYFVISGVSTSQPQYNSIVKVHTVTDANTVTAYLPRTPVASPTGTPVAWRVTSNFTITGGQFDYDYNNNTGGASIANVCGIFLGRAAKFEVSGVEVINGNKYGIHVGAVMDYSIRDCKAFGVTTGLGAGFEVLKTYGPARNGVVQRLYGRTTDDGASVQPQEDAAFAAFLWTGGDIFDLRYEDIFIDSIGGQATCIVYCHDNYIADEIYYKNINGTNTATSGQSIFAINRNLTGTTGIFGVIECDGVHGSLTGSAGRAVYTAATGAITGRRIKIRDCDAFSDGHNVFIGTNTAAELVVVEDTKVALGTDSNAGVFVQDATSIRKLVIRGTQCTQTAAAQAYVHNISSSGAGEIRLEECVTIGATNRRTALLLFSGATQFVASRNRHFTSDAAFIICQQAAASSVLSYLDNITDATQVFGLSSITGVINTTAIAKNNIATSNSLGFFRVNQVTNALTCTLKTEGNQIGNANHVVVPAGAPVISIYGWDLTVDPLALTGLATTAQQYLNSSRASAINQGPTVRSAAGWVALGTGASGVNTVIT